MTHAWMNWLRKIMGMKDARKRQRKQDSSTRVLQPAYTVRLKPEREDSTLPRVPARQEAPAPSFSITWRGITDVGMQRTHNEDFYAQCALGDRMLFVVADGMGGHDAGEVASRMAVDTVCREVRAGATRITDPSQLIVNAVRQANVDVRREGLNKGSDMGTTLSLVVVAAGTAHIASVGDSRVYWIENGAITQITEDHSLVAKLVAAGKLTKEEARTHPKSNILYRNIGADEVITVDSFTVPLKKGGMLLLCTDGLWGEVTEENMRRICAAEKKNQSVCAELVRMANENGGKDNITAMVVRVE